ncbi:hypothetical protein OIE82_27055 [Streptomyces althioticus]|uniref:Uncharacterized protein n=1 Tax=Streptomyces althioticus TaxID=83380 RepID=A0ABZ1YAM7_9ACTN
MNLNPDALAESGDEELDTREGVQEVTEDMILSYVLCGNELPPESARPFAEWLEGVWFSFNEDGDKTNGQVISGALAHWRGYK